jgi:hypothetical protein
VKSGRLYANGIDRIIDPAMGQRQEHRRKRYTEGSPHDFLHETNWALRCAARYPDALPSRSGSYAVVAIELAPLIHKLFEQRALGARRG